MAVRRPVVDPSGRAVFIEFFMTFQAMAAKREMDKKKINDETRLILVYAKKRRPKDTEHRPASGKESAAPRLGVPSKDSKVAGDVTSAEDASSSGDAGSVPQT